MKCGNILVSFGAALGFLLLAGCARDRFVLADQSVHSPQPPPFLSTPAVYFLTTDKGYFAKVRLEDQRGATSGRLYAQGPKLFYAPEEKKKPRKYGPVGGFSFIWDARTNSGFVLSEALQGYAPISVSGMGTVTNVTPTKEGERFTLVAKFDNGKTQTFEAVAKAGHDIPDKIISSNPPFNASFERVDTEAPPAEMFKVPAGFTAYPSVEAMIDEMAIRHRNLRRRVD